MNYRERLRFIKNSHLLQINLFFFFFIFILAISTFLPFARFFTLRF